MGPSETIRSETPSRLDAGALAILKPAYTPIARRLHWITAALVLLMLPLGFLMMRIRSGPFQDFLFALHESLGITLMLIIAFRLLYRLTHSPQPLAADIPALYRIAGHSLHWLFYALLIAQPILGWIGTSSYRAPIHFFGLFHVPPIWRQDRAFSDAIFWAHAWIGLALALLICVHVAAGLFHHFIRKDQVLMRMLRS